MPSFCECSSITQKQPPEVYYKKGVLKNFAKLTGKHLSQSLFSIKLQAPPTTLLKKRLWHRYHLDQLAVSVNFISQKNTALCKQMTANNLIGVSRFGAAGELLLLYSNKRVLQPRLNEILKTV